MRSPCPWADVAFSSLWTSIRLSTRSFRSDRLAWDFCRTHTELHWTVFFRRTCQDHAPLGRRLFKQMVWNIGDRLDAYLALQSSGQNGAGDLGDAMTLSERSVWGGDGRHAAQELNR